MLKIAHFVVESLPFDFSQEFERFSEAMSDHPFTIDVPAPSSHPFIEEAYRLGGFEIVDLELGVSVDSKASVSSTLKQESLKILESIADKKLDLQMMDVIQLLKKPVESISD